MQGVFYRASTYEQARQLHLTGWVRNTPDGCVEAVACGGEKQLGQFEAWLRQGPAMAVVEQLVISKQLDDSAYSEFEIRYC